MSDESPRLGDDLPRTPSGDTFTVYATSRRGLRWVIRRALLTSRAAGEYTRLDPDDERDAHGRLLRCGITEADAKAIAEDIIKTIEEDGLVRWSRNHPKSPDGIVEPGEMTKAMKALRQQMHRDMQQDPEGEA